LIVYLRRKKKEQAGDEGTGTGWIIFLVEVPSSRFLACRADSSFTNNEGTEPIDNLSEMEEKGTSW
jgi:hypothetical protein